MTHLASRSLRLTLALLALGAASVLGGCRPIRAYEPCSVNADCPGGTECLVITTDRDRMCTAGCTSDATCPLDRFGTNGRCLSFNDGADFTCWQACSLGAGGSECPFGYDCFDVDGIPICLPDRVAPTPTQRPYASCATTSQCLDATVCLTVNTDGDRMCTDSCTTDASCPRDRAGTLARCLSFDGSNFTCWQACNPSAGGRECEVGFGCFDTDGVSSFPPICLPL